jgi:hypothetical protein
VSQDIHFVVLGRVGHTIRKNSLQEVNRSRQSSWTGSQVIFVIVPMRLRRDGSASRLKIAHTGNRCWQSTRL